MPPWVYIVPEHVWAPYDGKDLKTIRDVSQTPAVGSGPFILTSWTPGQGFTMDRNPYYWGPHPDPEPDRVQGLYEPGGHDPGAEERGDRRAGRPAALADQLGPEQPEHHAAEGGVGLVAEPRVQLRRPARLDLHAAAGPARLGRPQGDRDGDRQERDRAEGVRGSRDAGGHDRAAGVGVLASGYPIRSGVRLRPDKEPAICSTRPATSIRTTTGSARTRRPASPSRSICRPRRTPPVPRKRGS